MDAQEVDLESLIGGMTEHAVPFDQLMPERVQNILLVSSLYDSFTIREHGDISESLLSEFLALDMGRAPRIVRVSTAESALKRLGSDTFQLVITTTRVGSLPLTRFREEVAAVAPDVPTLVLAYNERELESLPPVFDAYDLDKPFLWLGDVDVLLAMTKYIEDRLNVRHDTWLANVQSVILIEDSARFYSAFMPMLYRELAEQSDRVMADGLNRSQRVLRRRARPKVLLATTFDEALDLYRRFRSNVLGVITDVRYPRDGRVDTHAGLDFARMIVKEAPDLPVLVMSSDDDNQREAWALGAEFAGKTSPDLLHQVRAFLLGSLGFGDFVFKLPGGAVVESTGDLRGFLRALRRIPVESLVYHASRNHFSTWLMARGEIALAKSLRPRTVEEFENHEAMRQLLIQQIDATQRSQQRGVVADFSTEHFSTDSRFVRAGGGSMGGKGRGLAFVHTLFSSPRLAERFPNVRFCVPPTVVIGTSFFDRFMTDAGLVALALSEPDDATLIDAFLAHPLPDQLMTVLQTIVERLPYPLAVRSSSLLEDACYQPFAGVYQTIMLPNNDPDAGQRLSELTEAVKRVYASTYCAEARTYVDSTQWRVEEEKMAIVIQQLVGRQHEDYFYPDIGGVGRSVDFYPMANSSADEGVVCLALGLGRTIAEGGCCVRLSPRRPKRLYQFASTKTALDSSQRRFYALALDSGEIVSLELKDARRHGTLKMVASTYSPDNDRIYPGLSSKGVPLITMAAVLSGRAIPLPEIVRFMLDIIHTAFNGPAEIEFAVNLGDGTPETPHEISLLQIRPIVWGTDTERVALGEVAHEDAVVWTDKALGHGRIGGLLDIVYVPPQTFDRADTVAVATEIGRINATLRQSQRPYVLIGPGRWGSQDRWLGIPVSWSQINGARCIVETDMKDIVVTPSQGSHFFQNMTSLGIAYLTVNFGGAAGDVDFDWLDAQDAEAELQYVRHVVLSDPVEVQVDARSHCGMVLKPTRTDAPPQGS